VAETLKLTIEEVPAVAGKVNVHIEKEQATVRVDFGATQDPRFFERFLKGRPAVYAPHVMSRICGVCSVVHLTCSIEAVEKALGVEPKPEVKALRELAKGFENVQNNFVHVLMALPDYTGDGNVVQFSKSHPQLFARMMDINRRILEAYRRICGRFIHTPSLGVASHGKPITKSELEYVGREMARVSKELYELAGSLAEIWKPIAQGFEDPAPTYCVLKPPREEFPMFSNELAFSDGFVVSAERYGEVIEERKLPHSNAKIALYRGKPFYVGSRARMQAYFTLLASEARELIKTLGVDFSNPFDNVKAQYVEVAYLSGLLAEKSLELASRIRSGVAFFHEGTVPEKSGEGVGLATAPRGVLIHHYRVRDGKLEYANVITPTVMNARHIEVAGEALVSWALSKGIDEARVKDLVAALVRAYDPCLPCAVH
jgi:sulfhydrogenase subunit alpha